MSPEELAKSWESCKAKHMEVNSWVQELGFYRKHMARDSSCLFRAVSEGIFSNQHQHVVVREECAYYLILTDNRIGLLLGSSVDDYANKISNLSTYGGFNEVALMSQFYRRDFIIIEKTDGPIFKFCYGFGKTVYLYYQADMNHFDILLPFELIKKLSFCQSIVYEILYREVLYGKGNVQMDKNLSIENVDSHMRYKKDTFEMFWNKVSSRPVNVKNIYKNITQFCSSSTYFNSNDKSKKISLYPYKIERGLSPFTYKNIEFDIWIEIRKEEHTFRGNSSEENSVNYHDGAILQVGDKCLCKITAEQNAPYVCYVQAIKLDGPCLVYIEELGEKKTVHFSQLEPLPMDEAKRWFYHRKGNSKFGKKFNIKNKKTGSNVQDYQKGKKQYFGANIVEINSPSNISKDPNNNSIENNVYDSSTCPTVEWEKRNVDKGSYNNLQCLEKFTRIDYYSFKPQCLEYITMPFTVETTANARDNVPLNRQNSQYNYPISTIATTTASSSPCVQYTQPTTNGVEANNGNLTNSTYVTNLSSPITTSAVVPSGNNSNGVYNRSSSPGYTQYPTYYLPTGGVPAVRPPVAYYTLPPRPYLPVGVNLGVQRSVVQNGSDLPFNDIPTLRYFFNLGIDYVQMGGMMWPGPSPPLPLPPSTPMGNGNNYYNNQANQLALDMQNNLAIEDSPSNTNGPHDSMNKQYNNSHHGNNSQKPKYNNDYKGGRGGHARFRRNDIPNDRHVKGNSNFNRGGYNSIHKKNNTRNGNYAEHNATPDNNQEKKEHEQGEHTVSESPSSISAYNYFTYPPPPYCRYPYYPGEGENTAMPATYPPNYMSYGSEDGMMSPVDSGYAPQPGAMPPQFMTYIPPPQHTSYFYTGVGNGPNYFSPNFNNGHLPVENQPPTKNN